MAEKADNRIRYAAEADCPAPLQQGSTVGLAADPSFVGNVRDTVPRNLDPRTASA